MADIKKIIRRNLYSIQKKINWITRHIAVPSRPKYNKKFNLVICAIFKDEGRFLKEWIEYHELIGIEHFFLYNNNSADNFREILEPYIERGLVTLIDWPYNQGQISAYKDFYENHWEKSQWVSFLDLDEFVVPLKDNSLLQWIKKWDKNPVIVIYWKMFGSSGVLNHDDNKLCIEQYVNSWPELYQCGKCFINTNYKIFKFDDSTLHETIVYRKFLGFFQKFYPINQFHKIHYKEPNDVNQNIKFKTFDIQINHYWSKAWDVFNNKRKRSGDAYFKNNPKKNINYFLTHELCNTSMDNSIQRFLLPLKWKIKKMEEFNEMKSCN